MKCEEGSGRWEGSQMGCGNAVGKVVACMGCRNDVGKVVDGGYEGIVGEELAGTEVGSAPGHRLGIQLEPKLESQCGLQVLDLDLSLDLRWVK